MSKSELFVDYLREEGYVPKVDDDGDIIFKREGLSYILFAAEDDPAFFRVALPNFWPIESEQERQRVLSVAARINADVKVVKVFPVRDDVWASVEMFIDPIDGFSTVFNRSVQVIAAAIEKFRHQMRDLQ